jgi:hypothetical protein
MQLIHMGCAGIIRRQAMTNYTNIALKSSIAYYNQNNDFLCSFSYAIEKKDEIELHLSSILDV